MAPEQAVTTPWTTAPICMRGACSSTRCWPAAHPFARHVTPQSLIAAHLTEPPPPFKASDNVPPALAALVMQCLEKDPSRARLGRCGARVARGAAMTSTPCRRAPDAPTCRVDPVADDAGLSSKSSPSRCDARGARGMADS
jgi:serine/threonine-protein kinase